MPKNASYSSINQLGPEGKKSGVGDYVGNSVKGTAPSADAEDAKFRKPFPNMGQTKTGRE